ncbi:hypothetical protein [Solitalea lacus]|uniref:hypothetical protein n=1 Tax=Solitalea lacus TaxID=2911172 RepID=UPI001EDB62DC|nr:hypothetical protein [Solitalea lacus]UKJ08297.1 hypothetical protein L2B55_03780 [Solitalea lacus]
MKKLLHLFFLGIIGYCSNAQDLDGYRLSGGAYIAPKAYTTYKQLPFFKESFLKGKLTTVSGRVINPISLRFDMFAEELQYIYDKKVYLVSEPVAEFVLYDSLGDIATEYVFRRYFIEPVVKPKPVFCQVLYDGKTKLVKYVKKTEVTVSDMTSATTEKSFTDYQALYFQQGTNQLVKLDKNIKNLLLTLSNDKQQQVQNYIKTNKVKLSDEAQLTNLFVYLDNL